MAIGRDQPVRQVDEASRPGEPTDAGERSQGRDLAGDAEPRVPAAEPSPGPVAAVHRRRKLCLRWGAGPAGRVAQGRELEVMRAVESPQPPSGASAERAVRVVEHLDGRPQSRPHATHPTRSACETVTARADRLATRLAEHERYWSSLNDAESLAAP